MTYINIMRPNHRNCTVRPQDGDKDSVFLEKQCWPTYFLSILSTKNELKHPGRIYVIQNYFDDNIKGNFLVVTRKSTTRCYCEQPLQGHFQIDLVGLRMDGGRVELCLESGSCFVREG